MRKIIQFEYRSGMNTSMAVCDDGSIWFFSWADMRWYSARIPPIPQDEAPTDKEFVE